MNSLFTITTSQGGSYFSLFYLLAFFTCITIVLIAGIKRKYPILQLFTIVTTGVIFFIIGDKLFASSPSEWKQLISDFQLPMTSKKTVLGGLIGLIFGLWISKIIIGSQLPIFKPLAIALPIAMAIQRVGCLLAGCCFGKPTDLPWGIAYSSGSVPYHHHFNQGFIHASEATSLSVHPTQIYQILFCLLIAFIVWKTKHYWKSQGGILIFSILLYCFFRFFSEFFRDPVANGIAGQYFWGLKYAQWGILAGILALLTVLLIKERISRKAHKVISKQPSVIRNSIFIFLLLLITITAEDFFNPVEKLTIHFALVPAVIFVCWTIYKKFIHHGYRWVIPSLLIMSLFLMSQTYLPENKDEKITFSELGIAGMLSRYYDDVRQYRGKSVDGCTGLTYVNWSDPETRRYTTYLGAIKYGYQARSTKYNRFAFKASVFMAQDVVEGIGIDYHAKEITFAISPYLQWDWRMIGFGLGVHLGKFRLAYTDKGYEKLEMYEWTNSANEFNFYPRLRLRAGPYDIAFFETSIANFFPSSSPMPVYMVGLGSGLGKVDGTKIAAGYSDAGVYLQGVYPLKDRYVFNAFVANNFKSNYDARYLFGFGFTYRFDFKTVPRKIKTNKK